MHLTSVSYSILVQSATTCLMQHRPVSQCSSDATSLFCHGSRLLLKPPHPLMSFPIQVHAWTIPHQLQQLLPSCLSSYLKKTGQLLGSFIATAQGRPDGAHAAFAQYGADAVSITLTRTKVSPMCGKGGCFPEGLSVLMMLFSLYEGSEVCRAEH